MYTYRAVLLVLFAFKGSDRRRVDGTYFGGLDCFAQVFHVCWFRCEVTIIDKNVNLALSLSSFCRCWRESFRTVVN